MQACLLLFCVTMVVVVLARPGVAHPTTHQADKTTAQNTSIQRTSDGLALIRHARHLYQTEQYAQALTVWQQAVDAFQTTGDALKQAEALSNLSLTAQQLGQWNEAETAIQSAIALLTADRVPASQTSATVLAQTLDVQGRLYLERGQAELALEVWQQAADIYSQLEDSDRLIRNQINQAQALQSLGFYRQAQTQLTAATQTLQTQPDSSLKAIGLRSLGTALRLTGNLDDSRHVLQQGLAVAQAIGDAEEVGEIWLALGNTARVQRDLSSASLYYQQAATAMSPATAMSAQLHQFRLAIDNPQLNIVRPQLPQLLAQLTHLPLSRTTVYAHIYLAQSWMQSEQRAAEPRSLSTSDIQNPVPLIETAIQQARTLNDQRAEAYALGVLGNWYEITQQWAVAEQQTRQALISAQAIAASDLVYQWQWQLGRLLARRDEISEAIAAYEDAIKTLQSLRYDLVSVSQNEQFSFRENVEPAYRQLIELLLQPSSATIPAQQNLVKARETLELLQVAELRDFFREACADTPVLIDQVVEQTTAQSNASDRAAVLYPIILPDALSVVLKLPNVPELLYISTPVADIQVLATLKELRQALTQPDTFSVPQHEQAATQVYDWLIRPVETILQERQVNTLVFVLDGYLKNIPMAALHNGENYLIEQYSIALTPGLQLPDPKPLERQDIRLLFAGLSQTVPNEEFGALESVEREQEGILNLVPDAVVLLNRDFTKEKLQTQIEKSPFQIVHFATHGVFSENQDDTFILASNGRIKVAELDQVLRTQAQTQSAPIELLVLSACQTAKGDERAALGLAGVAVRAGARSTLASLWSVYDEVGAPLMIEFYRQLITTPTRSKAEALRQAQLTVLKRPDTRHPLYWSPYVLVGNWL